MANFTMQADEAGLQRLFLENMAHPSTQDILKRVAEALEERRRLESEERRRHESEERRRRERELEEGDSSDDGDDDEEEDPEEIEQVKAIEKMLEDPEMRLERVPRYFFKITNTYFMSA